MKWKKIFYDPSFWLLLGLNIWLVYYYEQRPEIFTTLIWLYWSQSVLYGLSVYIDIRTTPEAKKVPSTPTQPANTALASLWMFTAIYTFFHLAYIVFLFNMRVSGPFDWYFFKKFLAIFGLFQFISFVQHKIQNRTRPADIEKMSTVPFIRVIPMHLCIILSGFFPGSSLSIFLVVKVVADMAMYIATTGYYREGPVVSTTATNIESMIQD